MIQRDPHFFMYVVKVDTGFAPNPVGSLCTLACCKPTIRKTANIGDWIIGTTPSPDSGKVIYAMRVTRGLTFDFYFDDPTYACKKPGQDNPRGDNIYRKGENGALQQIDNPSHNEKNIKKDISVNRVLISNDFYYFGKNAPVIPESYTKIIQKTRGHRRIKPTSKRYSLATDLLSWLKSEFEMGSNGMPMNEKQQCKLPEERSLNE